MANDAIIFFLKKHAIDALQVFPKQKFNFNNLLERLMRYKKLTVNVRLLKMDTCHDQTIITLLLNLFLTTEHVNK